MVRGILLRWTVVSALLLVAGAARADDALDLRLRQAEKQIAGLGVPAPEVSTGLALGLLLPGVEGAVMWATVADDGRTVAAQTVGGAVLETASVLAGSAAFVVDGARLRVSLLGAAVGLYGLGNAVFWNQVWNDAERSNDPGLGRRAALSLGGPTAVLGAVGFLVAGGVWLLDDRGPDELHAALAAMPGESPERRVEYAEAYVDRRTTELKVARFALGLVLAGGGTTYLAVALQIHARTPDDLDYLHMALGSLLAATGAGMLVTALVPWAPAGASDVEVTVTPQPGGGLVGLAGSF